MDKSKSTNTNLADVARELDSFLEELRPICEWNRPEDN